MVKNTDITCNINNILDTEITEILQKNKEKTKEILVLSGGSTKGVAQIGALHCLKKHNLLKNINTIAASSAGTMVGLLYCAGYNPVELFKVIQLIDMSKTKKLTPSNVITKFGFDDGTRMMLVMKKLLCAKGYSETVTFLEFYKKNNITFIVTGTCINDKSTHYFSYVTHPDMCVLDAIRISISIPIVLTPFIYKGNMYIDGGCTDNFPIDLFSDKLDSVIGIYVTESVNKVKDIKCIEEFFNNTIQSIFEGTVIRDIGKNDKCVITVRCTFCGDSLADITNMFDEGYNTALQKITSHKWV